jgi:ABC-2 type transport system ATP-binding protein
MNDRISGGQKQRLLLALALINQPDLIFLDEPSTGLDPQARRDLWQIVESIKSRGKTLVLTTHYMEEAQTLCDDIVIMDHGKVIAHGTPEKLISKYCQGERIMMPKKHLSPRLKDFPFPHKERGTRVEIHPQDVKSCLEFLVADGVDLRDITVHAPNLEDVFIHLTGRKLRN